MITLADIQRKVGVAPDGKWGPNTAAAIARALGMESTRTRTMRDPAAFFAVVRKVTGPLDQIQVDTITAFLASAAHWPLSWLAYGLATAWHEARFKPVEEIGKGRGKRYANPGARSDGTIGPKYGGDAPYGRGLVQVTWVDNYEWLDEAASAAGLIKPGELLADFDLALRPDIAVFALVKGMEDGAFTGRSLSTYLPGERGTTPEFEQARRIINGVDRKKLIADHAIHFQDAGSAGGWA